MRKFLFYLFYANVEKIYFRLPRLGKLLVFNKTHIFSMFEKQKFEQNFYAKVFREFRFFVVKGGKIDCFMPISHERIFCEDYY